MSDDKFVEPLKEAGLGDYIEGILKYKKPCIRLHAQPVEDMALLPLGASRIGGLPDMPPNTTWPVRNGRSCEFIAQIDLNEASQYDQTGLLPQEGQLLFFFDGLFYEDEITDVTQDYQLGSETILYYTGPVESLERITDYPSKLIDWQHFRACSITFNADWMIPNRWCHAAILLEKEVFQRMTIYDPETPEIEAYEKVTYKFEPYDDSDKHHLLGYPEPVIQDDPLYEVSGAWDGRQMDEERQAEWMLLLQISSDDGPGMLWGDTSSLYYCIRKDDLIEKRFENAACVEQNY